MVVQTNPEAVPRRKLYLDEGKGVPVQSLWDDIPALHSQSGERLGYPTQKPLALLERILETSSEPGDMVSVRLVLRLRHHNPRGAKAQKEMDRNRHYTPRHIAYRAASQRRLPRHRF